MKVLGIDLSTHAVDFVAIDVDGQQAPEWTRYALTGQDAWERTRSVAEAVPGPTSAYYDDVLAIGVEDPRGYGAGAIYRVQGAVLARLPQTVLVQPWVPSQWRKAVGLKGNAGKGTVYAFAAERHDPAWVPIRRGAYPGAGNATYLTWPQDACDAYCIAVATMAAIETEKAA